MELSKIFVSELVFSKFANMGLDLSVFVLKFSFSIFLCVRLCSMKTSGSLKHFEQSVHLYDVGAFWFGVSDDECGASWCVGVFGVPEIEI